MLIFRKKARKKVHVFAFLWETDGVIPLFTIILPILSEIPCKIRFPHATRQIGRDLCGDCQSCLNRSYYTAGHRNNSCHNRLHCQNTEKAKAAEQIVTSLPRWRFLRGSGRKAHTPNGRFHAPRRLCRRVGQSFSSQESYPQG